MPYYIKEDGGEVDGEKVTEEPSAKHDIHKNSRIVFGLHLKFKL